MLCPLFRLLLLFNNWIIYAVLLMMLCLRRKLILRISHRFDLKLRTSLLFIVGFWLGCKSGCRFCSSIDNRSCSPFSAFFNCSFCFSLPDSSRLRMLWAIPVYNWAVFRVTSVFPMILVVFLCLLNMESWFFEKIFPTFPPRCRHKILSRKEVSSRIKYTS